MTKLNFVSNYAEYFKKFSILPYIYAILFNISSISRVLKYCYNYLKTGQEIFVILFKKKDLRQVYFLS